MLHVCGRVNYVPLGVGPPSRYEEVEDRVRDTIRDVINPPVGETRAELDRTIFGQDRTAVFCAWSCVRRRNRTRWTWGR